MLAPVFALLVAAWTVEAQDVDLYHNFGSVVFIRSGERTPTSISNPKPQTLTSLGAQQMFELGSNFRRRYITAVGEPNGLGIENIYNMSPNIIQNDQLFIQTLDKPYLVSSAQAFVQGLYPPSKVNLTQSLDSTYNLANGSQVDYPMGGYQYADIQALSELDPQSIYLDGMTNCPSAELASENYEVTDDYLRTRSQETSLYQSVNQEWLGSDVAKSEIDYRNAIDVYDHLSYAYTHNKTAYDALRNDTHDMYNQTRFLADQMAYYRYANTSSSSSTPDNQAMAGRTLSALILGQFQKIIDKAHNPASTVTPHPLTLLFGDFEPLISFFNIARVHQLNPYFKSIPPYASAMALELYSLQKNTTFPDSTDDLMVSFYFHNGTDGYDGQIETYSLFGNGNSQGIMFWKDFEEMMSEIMMNHASDWCTACDSPALFCEGLDGTTNNFWIMNASGAGRKKYKVTPAAAGAIGAVVTLAVAGFLFAAAMLLGGVRFHRNPSRNAKGAAGLGGFKGSAKLASDPDLSLANNAAVPAGAGIVSVGNKDGGRAAHERVGSWELRQKEFNGSGMDEERDVSPRGSFEAIEAAMSRPVQPTERV